MEKAMKLCTEAGFSGAFAAWKRGSFAVFSMREAIKYIPTTRDMKNTECVIYITTKRDCTQTYRKDNDAWTQTSPNGTVRRMTAEQLLSHLLPPLTTINRGHLTVRVERRNKAK